MDKLDIITSSCKRFIVHFNFGLEFPTLSRFEIKHVCICERKAENKF